MARAVAIVPHTHWDREWYSPFQSFRLRLVDLLDDFLPMLDRDLSYARFMLDGQMAVVDDYLEVRPDAAPLLRRLAAAGRLAMGPWYTLPDEFLVSGETHIRNLQLGLNRAAAFGGAMEVGYLPDMFGHIAQMPQILRLFGFEHAVVWRGVPAAVDRTAFWWEAPDGSTVRAQYLPSGYGNAAAVPDDVKALVQRIRAHERELGDMAVGGLLLMNGTDHQVPQPWLGRVVAEANDIQDEYDLTVTSLAEFLDSPGAPTDGLDTWRGEMRSGARANLLMGVASNRVDVKQAAARAERALERRAEPLAALYLPRWPGSLLDVAWREVVRNAAHDSICACSHDEVVDAVLHRYAEARQIADGIAERAVRAVAASARDAGPVVVNPSARTRGGVVELVLSDDSPVPGTQVLTARPATTTEPRRIRSSDLAALLGTLHGQRLSDTFFVNAIAYEEDDDGVDVLFRLGTSRVENAGVDEQRAELYEVLGRRAAGWHTLRLERPPMQRLLARIEDVPGLGWARWAPGSGAAPDPLQSTGHAPIAPVSVEGTTLSNGLATVEVDEATGTLTIDGVAGLDRLVDGGDHGDTYNFCPPEHDTVVDTPDEVEVAVAETGPLRATVAVRRTYTWPERVDDASGERVGSRRVDVLSFYELRAGERAVRVTVSVDNRCRDHRLRAWFPLPRPAATSEAECAFAIVERGLEAEGGPSEAGLPTFPSRRFVRAGGLTLVHEGLLEYELVDGGRALALTLLRANGMLSRGPMAARPEPAGPLVHLEGAQVQRPVELRYAVAFGDVDPYALVDDVFLPLEVVNAPGGGTGDARGSALTVTGAEVSSVRRSAGALEVRVYNPTPGEVHVDLDGRRGWLVDLRGRPLAPFDGAFPLGPWAIATAHLQDA